MQRSRCAEGRHYRGSHACRYCSRGDPGDPAPHPLQSCLFPTQDSTKQDMARPRPRKTPVSDHLKPHLKWLKTHFFTRGVRPFNHETTISGPTPFLVGPEMTGHPCLGWLVSYVVAPGSPCPRADPPLGAPTPGSFPTPGSSLPGISRPWEFPPLGVPAPGSSRPWEFPPLGVPAPGSSRPWEIPRLFRSRDVSASRFRWGRRIPLVVFLIIAGVGCVCTAVDIIGTWEHGYATLGTWVQAAVGSWVGTAVGTWEQVCADMETWVRATVGTCVRATMGTWVCHSRNIGMCHCG